MINQDYSIRPLAVAVILRAAREAKDNAEAAQWLLTDAPLWLDGIGIDLNPEQITAWIARGCKIPKRGALMLGA